MTLEALAGGANPLSFVPASFKVDLMTLPAEDAADAMRRRVTLLRQKIAHLETELELAPPWVRDEVAQQLEDQKSDLVEAEQLQSDYKLQHESRN